MVDILDKWKNMASKITECISSDDIVGDLGLKAKELEIKGQDKLIQHIHKPIKKRFECHDDVKVDKTDTDLNKPKHQKIASDITEESNLKVNTYSYFI